MSGTTICTVTRARRQMSPRLVISARSRRKSGTAPARRTVQAHVIVFPRRTGQEQAARQHLMFQPLICGNRQAGRRHGHRPPKIMFLPTRAAMCTEIPMAAGKRMMEKTGTTCPLRVVPPRPGQQLQTAPLHPRRPNQPGSRLLPRASPAPTNHQIRVTGVNPAWIARIIHGNDHKRAAASTTRNAPAAEGAAEGDR